MKINKSSWHYKLVYTYCDHYVPRNLCPYIRSLVASLLLWALLICGVTAISALMLTPLVVSVPIDLSVLAMILWAGLGLVLLKVSEYNLIPDYKWNIVVFDITAFLAKVKKVLRLEPKPKKIKKPSIFATYLKAVHDKTCPVIKFEDE